MGHDLAQGRGLWLQAIKGSISAGENKLEAGDALSTDTQGISEFTATEDSEALLFDLA